MTLCKLTYIHRRVNAKGFLLLYSSAFETQLFSPLDMFLGHKLRFLLFGFTDRILLWFVFILMIL